MSAGIRLAVIGACAACVACGRIGFVGQSDAGPELIDVIDATPDGPPGPCQVGRWQAIPGGGFEADDVASWEVMNLGSGVFMRVPTTEAGGAWAVEGRPKAPNTVGYSMGRIVPVVPGTAYVLSAFFDVGRLFGSEFFYVDLNDAPFEQQLFVSSGTGGWRFNYVAITIPAGVTSVAVRIVHDGIIAPDRPVFADEIALTPAADFLACQP